MRNGLILLGMMLSLFGPTAIFTYFGYKSMQSLNKRPTDSASVMIGLITKLLAVSGVLITVLVLLLKFFANKK